MRRWLLLSLCWCAALQAAPLPLEGWRVEGAGEARPAPPGFLAVTYAPTHHAPPVLRPPAPLPLPDDTARLQAWYARVRGDFDLQFLITDAAGEEHAVRSDTSQPWFPGVRRRHMRDWSVWNQINSVHFHLPAPLDERVQPQRRDLALASLWPRPLALTGISITPARDRRDTAAYDEAAEIAAGRGELWLTELDSVPISAQDAGFVWYLAERWRGGQNAPPRLLPDDLTRGEGTRRWRVDVRQGYQGPVVWSGTGEGGIDRTEPAALWAQRVDLPALPAGRYFVESRAWRPDGALETRRAMELFVARGPADLPLTPEPSTLGLTTAHEREVLPAETTEAQLHLRLSEPAGTYRLSVDDWRRQPVLRETWPAGTAPRSATVSVAAGTDYFASLERLDGDTVLDAADLHFGVASAPPPAAAPPAGLPTRDELLRGRVALPLAEHWGSLMSSRYDDEPLRVEQQREFDVWLDECVEYGFGHISFSFAWGEVEALPGVFRWDEIERRVRAAEAHGLQVFLTPSAWGDPFEFPRWASFEPLRDQHRRILPPARSGLVQPSYWDPVFREGYRGWLASVARRFRSDPAVIGYRAKPFLYVEENQPEFLRSDYSDAAQRAYDAWRAERGEPAEPLPPLFVLTPYSPARTGPDLSEAWRSFIDFRTHTYVQSVADIMGGIREIDAVRQIHVYRGSAPNAFEAAIPLLADGGEFHDEGGPFYFQRAMQSLCEQAGIPYTNEGHQFTPPSRAMIDAGFFYGSMFDSGWMWMYRWNIHRPDDPRFAGLPDALAHLRDSVPAMREWVAADGEEPRILVYGSRADQLLGGGRQGFYANIAGLDVFTALFSYHGVRAHFADEHTPWADPSRFDLVLACGEVMTADAMERLAAYAQAGGKLVLMEEAGRLNADDPAERDGLRGRVGERPNVRYLPSPTEPPPPPGAASRAPGSFIPALDRVLAWAGVEPTARVADPGFECVWKPNPGGPGYLAVFRRFPGSYDNIWYDDRLEPKWGRAATTVTIRGVPDGAHQVTKLHRERKPLGEAMARDGVLTLTIEPALVGELQILRVE